MGGQGTERKRGRGAERERRGLNQSFRNPNEQPQSRAGEIDQWVRCFLEPTSLANQ